MSKIIEKWLLFKYVDAALETTETKAQFENARMKYPERERKTIGIGGHLAALEQPDLLVEDIRAFFRPLRTE